MLKNTIRTIAIAVSIIAAPAVADRGMPIKIGSFVSLTGPGAFLGEPTKKTLELFVADLNKSGGINGRKVELVLYDSKSNAKDAAALGRRLIDQDEVDIIVGGTSTGETMAIVQTVQDAQIPFISLAGATVIVDPVKKYVFKTPHIDRMSVEKVFKQVAVEGGSKVALLSGAGGYDQSCRKNAADLAPRMNIKLVADEQHGTGDTDMTAQLTNIRGAGADAILYCGFGATSSIVAKNYKQLAIKPRLYMTVGVGSRAYIEGADGAAEGSRVTGSAFLAFKDLSPSDPIYAISKKFYEAYSSSFNEEPSNFAGYAYDGMLLATEALRIAGSTDKAKVRDAVERLRGVAGVNGVYNMSATDHLGINADTLRTLEVRGGEFRLVE